MTEEPKKDLRGALEGIEALGRYLVAGTTAAAVGASVVAVATTAGVATAVAAMATADAEEAVAALEANSARVDDSGA